jgi:hypothetical protein
MRRTTRSQMHTTQHAQRPITKHSNCYKVNITFSPHTYTQSPTIDRPVIPGRRYCAGRCAPPFPRTCTAAEKSNISEYAGSKIQLKKTKEGVHSVGLNLPPTLSVQPTLVRPRNGSISIAKPRVESQAANHIISKTTARIPQHRANQRTSTTKRSTHASDVPLLHGLPRHFAVCLRQAAQVIPRTLVQRHLCNQQGNQQHGIQNTIEKLR